MPRTKKQYEEMRNATREKIQSAAIKLFAQNGLAATNVAQIAELAGISTGLMYRHYKSKEELFYELVEIALEGQKEVAKLLGSDASPKDIIEQIAGEIIDDLNSNEDFINLLMLMTQSFILAKSDEKLKALITGSLTMISASSDLIKRGQDLGEFAKGNPEEMAALFFSSIQGLGIMKFLLGENFATPSITALTAFLYVKGDASEL